MDMNAKTYQQLLDAKGTTEGELTKALNEAETHISVANLTDRRIDKKTAAENYLSFRLNCLGEPRKNNVVLKTLALRILFADENFYQQINDLPDETIAFAFNTTVENVACKKALDKKMQQFATHKTMTKIR